MVSPALRPAGVFSHGALPGIAKSSAQLLASWHLLSLDAPTVAALWVVCISRSARVTLPWTDAAAMFTAVWILYATDRLLDARALKSGAHPLGLEARHRFHDRHRAWFYAGFAVACPLLAFMLRYASKPELHLELLLGVLLFAWLLLIHLPPVHAASLSRLRLSRLPKELAVGVFFPAAIFIPVVARVPSLRLALLPDATLLAAACSLNCLYIFAWEHSPHHNAHWSTHWATRRLPQLTVTTIVASAAIAALYACSGIFPQQPRRLLALPALACAASAALLLLVHHRREHMSSVTLRAAADLCLLTPALFLLAG